MNKQRLLKLHKIDALVTEDRNLMEEIHEEEEEYLNNIPENLQGGERYERTSEVVDMMEENISNLEECENNIEEIIS